FAARQPDEFFTRGYYTVQGGPRDFLANWAATALLPLHTFGAYRTAFGEGHAFDEIGVGLTEAGLPVVALLSALLVIAFFFVASREARRSSAYLLCVLALAVLLLGFTGPSASRLLLVQPVFAVLAAVALGTSAARLPRALVAGLLVVWAAFQLGRYVIDF